MAGGGANDFNGWLEGAISTSNVEEAAGRVLDAVRRACGCVSRDGGVGGTVRDTAALRCDARRTNVRSAAYRDSFFNFYLPRYVEAMFGDTVTAGSNAAEMLAWFDTVHGAAIVDFDDAWKVRVWGGVRGRL